MNIDNKLSFDNYIFAICKKINNQYNVILRFCNLISRDTLLQCDYSNQGHSTKFSTNLTNKIVEVNNSFQQIILENKLYITKATELWSFWIICWKIIVNLHDL